VAQLRAAALIFPDSPLPAALEQGASCVHGAALYWLAYYTTLSRVVPKERAFRREDTNACDVAALAGLLHASRSDVPAWRAQAACTNGTDRGLWQWAWASAFALREQIYAVRTTGRSGGFVNSKNKVMGGGRRRVAVEWSTLKQLGSRSVLHDEVRALASELGYADAGDTDVGT